MTRHLGLAAVLLTLATASGATEPRDALFRFERIAELARGFDEPSGIAWHPARGTMFVVGDEGDLAECTAGGEVLRQKRFEGDETGGRVDFEGVTVDPASGLLYVVVEGDERVLEIEPEHLSVRRAFDVERTFGGNTVVAEGGQGFEAIAFVPRPDHPEGGTFLIANQAWRLDRPDDRSVIVEVALPLRSMPDGASGGDVPILRMIEPGVTDLSGMLWEADRERLLVVSDDNNALLEMTLNGDVMRVRAFPGAAQEGIALDGAGDLYIAQDSGGILKVRPVETD